MAEDIGTELRAYLLTRPTLIALLDRDSANAPRIHPSILPQTSGKTPAAIVYHLISDVTEGCLPGVTTSHHLSHAVIQFDCYASSPLVANRIRTQLKAAMDVLNRGAMGNLRSVGTLHEGDRDETVMAEDGSESHQFIRQCDYRISYQRPTGI
jgi:hypothetical protein